MHEDENKPSVEKDFKSLISQFNNHSEIRDKLISEIDDILDRIKQNRKPSAELNKQAPLVNDPPVFITQLRALIQKVDESNNKLGQIVNRLNELV